MFNEDAENIGANALSQWPWKEADTQLHADELLWMVIESSSASMFVIKHGEFIMEHIPHSTMLGLMGEVKDVPENEQLQLVTALAQNNDEPDARAAIEGIISMASIPTIFNEALKIVERQVRKDE